MVVFLFFVSCTDLITGSRGKKANISGAVVETFYDETTIFSVRGLADVAIIHAGDVVAVTNMYGHYRLYMRQEGDIWLRAFKENYRPSRAYPIYSFSKNDPRKHIDFWLEREDEESHGWFSFSEGLTRGELEITPKGLTLLGWGRGHLYATKLIELPNSARYRFSTKVLMDVLPQYAFFEVLPQIPNDKGMRHNLNNTRGWHKCSVTLDINHVIIEYIWEHGEIVDTLFTRPPMVDIVLKIGVGGGTQNPQAYFNEIRVVKE